MKEGAGTEERISPERRTLEHIREGARLDFHEPFYARITLSGGPLFGFLRKNGLLTKRTFVSKSRVNVKSRKENPSQALRDGLSRTGVHKRIATSAFKAKCSLPPFWFLSFRINFTLRFFI